MPDLLRGIRRNIAIASTPRPLFFVLSPQRSVPWICKELGLQFPVYWQKFEWRQDHEENSNFFCKSLQRRRLPQMPLDLKTIAMMLLSRGPFSPVLGCCRIEDLG